ncbi:MAG: hypothetical protein RLZZ502_88 [Pseudomonadota bacterium]|jgi:hypothetical protein
MCLLKKFCFLVLTSLVSLAQADVYTFTQTGFSDGGTLTGTFTASDLDNDGQIVYASFFLPGEVTAITASYTGGAIIPNLTFGLGDLFILVWNVGSPYIGDETNGYVEGIMFMSLSGNTYAAGLGPNSFVNADGKITFAGVTGEISAQSSNLVEVNNANVPLPSSLLLLGFAVALLRRQVTV